MLVLFGIMVQLVGILYQLFRDSNMAITIIQTASVGSPGGGNNLSFASPVTPGNLIIVGLQTFNPAGVISAVNDGNGGVWAPVPNTDTAFGQSGSSMWYNASAISNWTTMNITHSGAVTDGGAGYLAMEISGAAASPIESSGGLGANGQPSGPSLTNTNAGDLLLAFADTSGSGNTGVNSPWTYTGTQEGFAYYLPGTTGTFQAIFTPSQTCDFAASGVVISPSATGASAKKKASTNLIFD
jgi:hypothetical protein